MKTLFLVRHAKSSRDDPALPDRDRPLNERGLREAPKVAAQLAKRDVRPDVVLSSPALRALATAEIFGGKLDYDRADIVVDDRIYDATPGDLLAVVHDQDDGAKRVMLFGHNPGLAELANHLSRKVTGMPTCAVVEFAFDTKSWSDVGVREPAKVTIHHPREA